MGRVCQAGGRVCGKVREVRGYRVLGSPRECVVFGKPNSAGVFGASQRQRVEAESYVLVQSLGFDSTACEGRS